jgi:PiT family inorganic phosphate transporter
VIWSGAFNFLGVLTSSGAVAFTVVSLLPVELILQVGSGAGFAMVFALLIAAILWNLGTWYFGLPNSSSHTLDRLDHRRRPGQSADVADSRHQRRGLEWRKMGVFKGLVFSPIAGFHPGRPADVDLKAVVKIPALYKAPEGNKPPPWPIRALLVLTCTGVSFSHGSNDGQKGMGLIMLILIGTVPTAYALNGAVTGGEVKSFHQVSAKRSKCWRTSITVYVNGDPRKIVTGHPAAASYCPIRRPAHVRIDGGDRQAARQSHSRCATYRKSRWATCVTTSTLPTRRFRWCCAAGLTSAA